MFDAFTNFMAQSSNDNGSSEEKKPMFDLTALQVTLALIGFVSFIILVPSGLACQLSKCTGMTPHNSLLVVLSPIIFFILTLTVPILWNLWPFAAVIMIVFMAWIVFKQFNGKCKREPGRDWNSRRGSGRISSANTEDPSTARLNEAEKK